MNSLKDSYLAPRKRRAYRLLQYLTKVKLNLCQLKLADLNEQWNAFEQELKALSTAKAEILRFSNVDVRECSSALLQRSMRFATVCRDEALQKDIAIAKKKSASAKLLSLKSETLQQLKIFKEREQYFIDRTRVAAIYDSNCKRIKEEVFASELYAANDLKFGASLISNR